MPKLIIPNTWDITNSELSQPTHQQMIAEIYYATRFIWLVSKNDLVLLPTPLPHDFLLYVAQLKKISLNQLRCIITTSRIISSATLYDSVVIKRLKRVIKKNREWSIEPYFYTDAIVNLAEALQIPLDNQWKNLVSQDLCLQLNSKAEFRRVAINQRVPLPTGQICKTVEQFKINVRKLITITNQIIIKPDYTASGTNIGVSLNKASKMQGVESIYHVKNLKTLTKIAEKIWRLYTNTFNRQLIIEVYYSNAHPFTCEIYIPYQNKLPQLMNYSEIRMENGSWIGVETPAHRLKPYQISELITESMKLAYSLFLRGYKGYVSCDAILTSDNKLFFTEINARMSGALHIYKLAETLFGKDYPNKICMLSRRQIKIDSFHSLYKLLKKENLLFSMKNRQGIVILNVDAKHLKLAECLTIASDYESACFIEKRFLEKIS